MPHSATPGHALTLHVDTGALTVGWRCGCGERSVGVWRSNVAGRADATLSHERHAKRCAPPPEPTTCDSDHDGPSPAATWRLTMLDTTSLDAVTDLCSLCLQIAFTDGGMDPYDPGTRWELARL